jgi:2-succinyl-5-enolpyruvyl-6-hydroxy-3-cyclohexene-1-carboxylate synthase
MKAPNRNLLWARVFAEELALAGVREAVIAPGSRSTPLVFALDEQPEITVYSLLDERSAAYFALGLASANGRPAALVCTSGTAGANFYPAVVEANSAGVPMVVLTADRSPELRESGANQTIDQIRLFGAHVNWFVEVALPEADPPDIALRGLRTLAQRAVSAAHCPQHGPVHLNFPFRKPLEPTELPGDRQTDASRRVNAPFVRMLQGRRMPAEEQVAQAAAVLAQAQRGLIICGPRTPDEPAMADAVRALQAACGFPVLADALSGLRYRDGVIRGYDTFLRTDSAFPGPDVVIQLGAQAISQSLEEYLNRAAPEHWITISSDGRWLEPNFWTSMHLTADPAASCHALAGALEGRALSGDPSWGPRFAEADAVVRRTAAAFTMTRWFDGAVLAAAVPMLSPGSALVIGSSLPVRHLDQFALDGPADLKVYGNRGASGIDGTISTAAGVAAADHTRPVTLILGDVAFYHDMNGLLALQRAGVRLVIVVVNNNGGGIFERLPVARFEPIFTELFLTPHGLQFENAAALYGTAYERPVGRAAFEEAFARAQRSAGSTIIEVSTDSKEDLAARSAFLRAVSQTDKG